MPFLLTESLLNPHDICGFENFQGFEKMLPTEPVFLPPLPAKAHDNEELPSAVAAEKRAVFLHGAAKTHGAARCQGRRCVPVSTPQFQRWTVIILGRLTGGECGCVGAEIVVRIFLLFNQDEGHGVTRMLGSIACDI